VIPYDPRKGNWFVSRWTKLNTLYLVPIFTHSGRPINTFFPDWCVPVCTKCKPSHDQLEESEISESELSEEEEEEEDKVISFRNTQQEEEEEIEEAEEVRGGAMSTAFIPVTMKADRSLHFIISWLINSLPG